MLIKGDTVVYKLKGQAIPIVHRVLELHQHNKTGDTMLTRRNFDSYQGRLQQHG